MTFNKQAMLQMAADELDRAHRIIADVSIGALRPAQAFDLLDAHLSRVRFALRESGIEQFQSFDFDAWVRERFSNHKDWS